LSETKEIKINISKKDLDEYSADRITELEHKLDLAEKREKKAKKRVKELENHLTGANQIRNAGEEFARQVVEITDMYGEFQLA